MPEWIWLIALFVAGSAFYWIGYLVGVARTDKPQSDNAWINVRKYAIDAEAEVCKYQMDKDLEYKKAALDRGIFDYAVINENDEDDEEEQ